MTRNIQVILASAVLLAGCSGRSADLGGDQMGWATALDPNGNAPFALYRGSNWVQGIAVDDSKIYAILVGNEMGVGPGYRIYSCELASCASTVELLFADSLGIPRTGLLLSYGELFWADDSRLLACASDGCDGQARRVGPAVGARMVADADNVYWLEGAGGLVRCPRAGCDTPVVVAPCPPSNHWDNAGRLEIVGDALLVQFIGTDGSVWRIRRDGSEAAIVDYKGPRIGGIASNTDNVFVATAILTGQVLRCPPGGCAGNPPELVADQQRWPSQLLADDRGIYWASRGSSEGDGSVTGCPLAGSCDPRVIASSISFGTDAGASDFAMNTGYLFWSDFQRREGMPLGLIVAAHR
jgi:hypothetical protein